MNEKGLIKCKLNKQAIKIDKNLNKIKNINAFYFSNIDLQSKQSKQQISSSFNTLFSKVNSDLISKIIIYVIHLSLIRLRRVKIMMKKKKYYQMLRSHYILITYLSKNKSQRNTIQKEQTNQVFLFMMKLQKILLNIKEYLGALKQQYLFLLMRVITI